MNKILLTAFISLVLISGSAFAGPNMKCTYNDTVNGLVDSFQFSLPDETDFSEALNQCLPLATQETVCTNSGCQTINNIRIVFCQKHDGSLDSLGDTNDSGGESSGNGDITLVKKNSTWSGTMHQTGLCTQVDQSAERVN